MSVGDIEELRISSSKVLSMSGLSLIEEEGDHLCEEKMMMELIMNG